MIQQIQLEVVKVLELIGAYSPDFNCPSSIYAHVSKLIKINDVGAQYAMLAMFSHHGTMHLGDINPGTKMFEHYDFNINGAALYTRAPNHIVNVVSVPIEQVNRLKTLDKILNINGISIKRELIPGN